MKFISKKFQNTASNSDPLVGVRALYLDTTKSALRRNRAIVFPSPTPLQAPMTYAWVCHALFYDKIVLFKYREDPGYLFGVCFHNNVTIFHVQLCRCDCYVTRFQISKSINRCQVFWNNFHYILYKRFKQKFHKNNVSPEIYPSD